jgi:N-acetylglutamate synthase-like GNAT family acetyltransferase
MIVVRHAMIGDIPEIKAIADKNKLYLGFVNRASLIQSLEKQQLIVALYGSTVVGFANLWYRRDGWTTIMELCVAEQYRRQGIGGDLIQYIRKPIRLKCTTDNPANDFYRHCEFVLAEVLPGRKRDLNLWKLTSSIVQEGTNSYQT